MQYEILLKGKKYDCDGEWGRFRESFLPGMKIKERLEPMLTVDFAEQFKLCDGCSMDTHCHPMKPDGSKYCTILLYDAVKPKWKLKDVV